MPTKTKTKKKKPAKQNDKKADSVNITQFLQAADWRIDECVNFGGHCYGPSTRIIDVDLPRNSKSVSAVFNSKTGRVFEICACDYRADAEKEDQAYRWVDPKFKNRMRAEARRRNFDETIAWDDTPWKAVSKMCILNRVAYLCGTLKTKPAHKS